MDFLAAAKRIQKLTAEARRDTLQVDLCYYEEYGELCQELAIFIKVPGKEYKKPGPDGIYGECADVWICALSSYYKDYDDVAEEWLKQMVCTTVNLSMNDLIKKVINFRNDKATIAYYVMQLALICDENPENFLKKINEKLDKWEKNVQFITIVESELDRRRF